MLARGLISVVCTSSSPVRERERDKENERRKEGERKRERERERCRICPELLFFIFKRNDGCLGTF
jgi:hypothetical protein